MTSNTQQSYLRVLGSNEHVATPDNSFRMKKQGLNKHTPLKNSSPIPKHSGTDPRVARSVAAEIVVEVLEDENLLDGSLHVPSSSYEKHQKSRQ